MLVRFDGRGVQHVLTDIFVAIQYLIVQAFAIQVSLYFGVVCSLWQWETVVVPVNVPFQMVSDIRFGDEPEQRHAGLGGAYGGYGVSFLVL